MEKFSPKTSPEFPVATTPETGQARGYKTGIVEDLVNLDRDLMKLLVRRAKLVNKLRGGKPHAATPAAAQAEKQVRTAWEKNALSFSRDNKFVRQLFSLLQEVHMDSREEAETKSKGFNLAPARKPVAVSMPGPLSSTAARMLAAMAAATGGDFSLENVVFSTPLIDCLKALNGAGAKFSWKNEARSGEGSLTQSGARPVSLGTDKALYVGEDILTLYIMAFLAVAKTGKARFTGGSGLKMADLSPLRRFLPTLGARMAHSVPKSNGLPASIEASGVVPDHIVIPADLPHEGVTALFCAAATWKRKVAFDCGSLPMPRFTTAVAECLHVLRACSVVDEIHGSVLTLDSSQVRMSEQGLAFIDPVLSAYILALPAFAGGSVALAGEWEEVLPQAAQATGMLTQAGINVEVDGKGIRTTAGNIREAGLAALLDIACVDDSLVPLGLAIAARETWRKKGETPLPVLPEHIDMDIVEAFFSHLNLVCRDGVLSPMAPGDKTPWACPSAEWGMAYALCAYDCPNISLANPAAVTARMPSFWAFYNSLPDPSIERNAPEKQEKTRRRIISATAQGVE